MFITQAETGAIDFDGLTIFDYTAGRDGSSSFAEITIPSGARHKASWSTRSDKYYYVVQGVVLFTVDEEARALSPGDVCVVPRGVRFWYQNDGPSVAKVVLVHTPSFDLVCERFED